MNIDRKRTPREIRGAIIGTLLGDSYINTRYHKTFTVEQASKSLVDYKQIVLEQIPSIQIHRSERTRRTQMLYTLVARHPMFEKIRKILYVPTKQVNARILTKLTDEGIAWWYMDDGTKIVRPERRYVILCTDNFDHFSQTEIVRYFKDTYDLNAKIILHRDKKYGNKERICFVKYDAQQFVARIYPFILPEFYYKLDLRYTMPFYMVPEYAEIQQYIQQHSTQKI